MTATRDHITRILVVPTATELRCGHKGHDHTRCAGRAGVGARWVCGARRGGGAPGRAGVCVRQGLGASIGRRGMRASVGETGGEQGVGIGEARQDGVGTS